jgi:hypothetical protein
LGNTDDLVDYATGPAGGVGLVAASYLIPPVGMAAGIYSFYQSGRTWQHDPSAKNLGWMALDAALLFCSGGGLGGGSIRPGLQGALAYSSSVGAQAARVGIAARTASNVLMAQDGQGQDTGANDNAPKYVYTRKTDAPKWPDGFTRVGNPITVKVKQTVLLNELRKVESGQWVKVYENGYLPDGRDVSIHYFRSPGGLIFDLDVKNGWS